MAEQEKERLMRIIEKKIKELEKKDSLTPAETTQASYGLELMDRIATGQLVTGFEVSRFLEMVR